MTFENFDKLVYDNVVKTYELNKCQKIIDGFNKDFWRKCMHDIFAGFDKKNSNERLKFTYNELAKMKAYMKTEDFENCVDVVKNKTEDELYWWLAANDATACYMQFGIT